MYYKNADVVKKIILIQSLTYSEKTDYITSDNFVRRDCFAASRGALTK